MNTGFIRVGAAVPKLSVANPKYNLDEIVTILKEAADKNIGVLVFPELSVTGYTCADLFHQQRILKDCIDQVYNILEETKDIKTVFIIGMPICLENRLFNCAVVINCGKVLGIVPKSYIPGYGEFYEKRWFSSGINVKTQEIQLFGQNIPFGVDLLFEDSRDPNICFGIEICEDLWTVIPPSSYQVTAGASIIFNLSASNEVIGKHEYRKELIKTQSARGISGYVYASSGVCESTTDVVFGGYSMICENGSVLAEGDRFKSYSQLIYSEIDVEKLINLRFSNLSFMENLDIKHFRKVKIQISQCRIETIERYIDPHPFVPSNEKDRDKRCEEILAIQTAALAKRLRHTGLKKVVIGISGGLDSTLALLVVAMTFEMLNIHKENIIAITMPGFGTTGTTYNNALLLMNSIGTTVREIDIKEACIGHFKDIGHDQNIHDVTYENVQARERTKILMNIANKMGALVIGTGDLSELALGWCTYNGDHMSMYSVNCGIPKTLIKFLVKWVADNRIDNDSRNILQKIIDTPISPELLPPSDTDEIVQKTEDIVGPYELHDFFLYYMLRYGTSPKKILLFAVKAFANRYSQEEIKKWLITFYKRFFSQQFKRSCLPDGPKVGTISVSPRGDLRMPSDADVSCWLNELNSD